jgi:hypothetical protein
MAKAKIDEILNYLGVNIKPEAEALIRSYKAGLPERFRRQGIILLNNPEIPKSLKNTASIYRMMGNPYARNIITDAGGANYYPNILEGWASKGLKRGVNTLPVKEYINMQDVIGKNESLVKSRYKDFYEALRRDLNPQQQSQFLNVIKTLQDTGINIQPTHLSNAFEIIKGLRSPGDTTLLKRGEQLVKPKVTGQIVLPF